MTAKRRESPPGDATAAIWAWRHPRPVGATGRCIGAGTDLPVDARRAKRLAHQIRTFARQQQLPPVIWTSPLQRCQCVGAVLAHWGWRHHLHPGLREMHFGRWEGQRWEAIAQQEVEDWEQDFLHHAPGDGERLSELLTRVASSLRDLPAGSLVVTHGGWITAAHWLLHTRGTQGPACEPSPQAWPRAPAYGSRSGLAVLG